MQRVVARGIAMIPPDGEVLEHWPRFTIRAREHAVNTCREVGRQPKPTVATVNNPAHLEGLGHADTCREVHEAGQKDLAIPVRRNGLHHAGRIGCRSSAAIGRRHDAPVLEIGGL
ncbi:hypothetical protein Ga0080574_TMP3870 [Salipiger abyssi]|uniref:Uncharacterized protein n=1 Tax=Salipiger abyssi TaxID=1250539 RepID=A0A1P8UXS8_9RHOB|nr:hypothetical protein Ga0080574_TMP3870 [Salipiger abyssi]